MTSSHLCPDTGRKFGPKSSNIEDYRRSSENMHTFRGIFRPLGTMYILAVVGFPPARCGIHAAFRFRSFCPITIVLRAKAGNRRWGPVRSLFSASASVHFTAEPTFPPAITCIFVFATLDEGGVVCVHLTAEPTSTAVKTCFLSSLDVEK